MIRTFWRAWYGLLDALCRIGIHESNYSGNAYSFAPAPIRCERCGKKL